MAIQLVNIDPVDPHNATGPVRELAGIVKTGDVTLDALYGTNGTLEYARWIYIGNTGNLSFVKWDGTTQILVNLTGGVFHPIHSVKINSIGTNATNIVWGS